MTLDTVASAAGLEFYFIADEQYDIAIRQESWERPAVAALRRWFDGPDLPDQLRPLGFSR